eukprot:1342576-Amorphochlora_amoeboformis.AAC.1
MSCAMPTCKQSYHLACAVNAGCVLDKNQFVKCWSFWCPKHAHLLEAAGARRASHVSDWSCVFERGNGPGNGHQPSTSEYSDEESFSHGSQSISEESDIARISPESKSQSEKKHIASVPSPIQSEPITVLENVAYRSSCVTPTLQAPEIDKPRLPTPGSAKSKATKDLTFRRKDKSLGLLCSKFIEQMSNLEDKFFLVDESAERLGGRRRRLYDIINILESIGIVSSLGRNKYLWHGNSRLKTVLKELKDEANSSAEQKKLSAFPNKKSLGLRQLTQQFIQMFFQTPTRIVSLEEAGNFLFQGHPNQASLKSKKRRLYDIANVLVSAKVLAKIRYKDERQPALLWKGAGVLPLESNKDPDSYIFCEGVRTVSNSPKHRKKTAKSETSSSSTPSSSTKRAGNHLEPLLARYAKRHRTNVRESPESFGAPIAQAEALAIQPKLWDFLKSRKREAIASISPKALVAVPEDGESKNFPQMSLEPIVTAQVVTDPKVLSNPSIQNTLVSAFLCKNEVN